MANAPHIARAALAHVEARFSDQADAIGRLPIFSDAATGVFVPQVPRSPPPDEPPLAAALAQIPRDSDSIIRIPS